MGALPEGFFDDKVKDAIAHNKPPPKKVRACESDACESDACESDACESDACESDACESDTCESDAFVPLFMAFRKERVIPDDFGGKNSSCLLGLSDFVQEL